MAMPVLGSESDATSGTPRRLLSCDWMAEGKPFWKVGSEKKELKPPPLSLQAVSCDAAPLAWSEVPPVLSTHGSSVGKLVVAVEVSCVAERSAQSVEPSSPELAVNVPTS